MRSLRDVIITNKRCGYQENIHYKFFICKKTNNGKTKIKKKLFLNFYGLIRLLNNTKDPKTKECNIVNIIQNNYNNINWICDKPLKCKYRPDMLSIINGNVLIIEIDEYQHKKYNANEDKRRTNAIYNEYENKNMTIIRFNPDIYKDYDNIKHNAIKDDDNEMSIRINILINTIDETINNQYSGLKEIKLFFDNYKSNDNNNVYNYQYNKNIKKKEITPDILKNIYATLFTNLCNGNIKEMHNKIITLEKQIIDLHHQLEIKDKNLELKDKDILIEKQKNELLEMKLMMIKLKK